MRTETYRLAAYLLALLLLFPFISGCSSLNTRTLDGADRLTYTETRVFCSLQRDEASILSRWGLFAFAFDLSQRDAPIVCRAPDQVPMPSVDLLLPDLGSKTRQ